MQYSLSMNIHLVEIGQYGKSHAALFLHFAEYREKSLGSPCIFIESCV